MLVLEKKINKKLNEIFLRDKHPKILVAVSGGPDSIALAFLVKKWINKRRRKGELFTVVFDHRIRHESYKEAIFVKKYLNSNNIFCKILRANKYKVVRKNMKQSRENRFSKITKFCKENHFFYLLMAHHFDDNIETFLLRKIAGSNIEGLNAMEEKTSFQNIQIIRPLLNFSKKELVKYCENNSLKFINDPSNLDEGYSRVVVRNFLKNNSKYKKNVLSDFKIIKNNYNDFMTMIFQNFILTTIEINNKLIVLDFKKFSSLNSHIQSKFIEIVYKFLYPKKPFLRYKKISNICKLLNKNSKILSDIGSMKIRKINDHLYFSV